MTLFESLLKYKNCKHKALYFSNKSISFEKLIFNIQKMVNYLRQSGIKKDDVVTVVLPNVPVTIYLFYALNALGAIQNIVHPLTPYNQILESMKISNSKKAIVLETIYQEIYNQIKDSDYQFFFVNPMYDKSPIMKNAFYFKYKKAKRGKNVFKIDDFRKCSKDEYIDSYDDLKDSIYLHSGGTTGNPKVIALSNYAINNLASKVDGIINDSIYGKSMLAVLPTFHGFGLGMGIHAPLYNGAATALMMKFNPKEVSKWINQNKVNMIIGVPLLYQKLLKEEKFLSSKLTNLTHCFVGGDNVSLNLIDEFNEVMRKKGSTAMLLEGYGLTETVTVCSVNTKQNFKIGSVGKALKGIDIIVLNDKFEKVNNNEIAEVFISGDTLMNGYLNDVASTKKTLVEVFDKTYVRTGDLGYLDEDGFLFLKGRMKRMFKVSGVNVYPNEIEKIAMESEDVYDASLEFFLNPKPHMTLFVIKNVNSKRTNIQIKENIINTLSKRVLKYSMPSKVVFLKEFPKTKVGKIDHKAFVDLGEDYE